MEKQTVIIDPFHVKCMMIQESMRKLDMAGFGAAISNEDTKKKFFEWCAFDFGKEGNASKMKILHGISMYIQPYRSACYLKQEIREELGMLSKFLEMDENILKSGIQVVGEKLPEVLFEFVSI